MVYEGKCYNFEVYLYSLKGEERYEKKSKKKFFNPDLFFDGFFAKQQKYNGKEL